jgi:hypothetical protein
VIDPDTKSNLTFQLGQLVKAIAKRQDDARQNALARIGFNVDLAACSPSLSEEVVNRFLELLRDGDAEIIREMKALADNNMPEDSDEEMQGNNSDATMTSRPGSNSGSDTSSLGSDDDATMASSLRSDDDATMASSSGNNDDATMGNSSGSASGW